MSVVEKKVLEENTDGQERNTPLFEVWIADDQMRGDIVFHKPMEGQEEVSLSQVLEYLKTRGIKDSVNVAAIEYAIENRMYERSLTFARGKFPINGFDGWYEFLFEREFSLKPAIDENGVADYHSLLTFARVEEGQLLMRYHEAIQGKPGYTIYGKELRPDPVRDLPCVPGKGFVIAGNGKEYAAEFAGKAEFKQGRLLVTKIHEIDGDVSTGTGDVIFDGNILVHGMVRTGMAVRATGDIIVDEICEAAELVAGGDIICRKGVLGNQTGYLKAGGSVSAQFLDKVEVEAGNSIFCSTAIQCKLKSAKNIVISGDKGALIGGECYAYETVECMQIGNASMANTKVSAGVTAEMVEQYTENANSIDLLAFTARNIQTAMQECSEAERKVYEEKMHENVTKLKKLRADQQKLGKEIKGAKESKIIVQHEIYAGCVIELGGVTVDITQTHEQMQYKFANGSIVSEKIKKL